ncbi:MAG TPA: wax ester/triacylglycerol synthase domain-containing protein [Nocardioidaceae bacterium]|nr:wax ester/triacylglycerol synthase domain-containing protein [Nocardioidaceae bacterium]
MGATSRQRPAPSPASRPLIERASATDRAFLAMDIGDVPEQFGVVLELSGHLTLARVRDLVGERIQAVPRLRQRLVGVPIGCGGPIWVDDAAFDIRRHVREVECRPPGDEQALLDTALALVMSPLSRSAPLWSAVLVPGLEGDRVALVVVLHHVLADGIGGLAVLAGLVDPGPGSTDRAFPRPRPTGRNLLADALVAKARALGGVGRSWRLLRTSMGAGGGLRPPRIADTSLTQRTGPDRRVAVVRADYARLRAAAHRHGATTNDAVLVAVAGALRRVLEGRGERIESVVVTVPVSGRRTDGDPDAGPALGNLVSPLLVPVPTTGSTDQRLAEVAALVRAGKADATGPPPIAVLGWLFRPLAALGGYRWYMNRQRRFHTLVSHLRGPAEPLTFGGLRVESAVPIGVAEGGNATVYFEVLSYAGVVTVAAMVDRDHFPDLGALVDALRTELDLVTADTHVAIPEQRRPGPALDRPVRP